MKDRAKMFGISSLVTQFVISFIFFVGRLMDGVPFFESLGKFTFAFILGLILCAIAFGLAELIGSWIRRERDYAVIRRAHANAIRELSKEIRKRDA